MNEQDIAHIISQLESGKQIEWRYPREGSFDYLYYDKTEKLFIWVYRMIYQTERREEYSKEEFRMHLLGSSSRDEFASFFATNGKPQG